MYFQEIIFYPHKTLQFTQFFALHVKGHILDLYMCTFKLFLEIRKNAKKLMQNFYLLYSLHCSDHRFSLFSMFFKK